MSLGIRKPYSITFSHYHVFSIPQSNQDWILLSQCILCPKEEEEEVFLEPDLDLCSLMNLNFLVIWVQQECSINQHHHGGSSWAMEKLLQMKSSIVVQNGICCKNCAKWNTSRSRTTMWNQALGGAVLALDRHGNDARKHSTVQVLLTCLKSTAMIHNIFGGMVEISGWGWRQQAVFLGT